MKRSACYVFGFRRGAGITGGAGAGDAMWKTCKFDILLKCESLITIYNNIITIKRYVVYILLRPIIHHMRNYATTKKFR